MGIHIEVIKGKRVGDTVKYGQYVGQVIAIEGCEAVVEFKKFGTVQRIETQYLTVVSRPSEHDRQMQEWHDTQTSLEASVRFN